MMSTAESAGYLKVKKDYFGHFLDYENDSLEAGSV